MKEKIEKLLKEKRKTKAELATLLNMSYQGLQNKINNNTFKQHELESVANLLGIEVEQLSVDETTSMWDIVKEQYEKRVEELTAALNDARYTIKLQRKMLGENVNFLNLSKKPPVRNVRYAGMRIVAHTSQLRA